MLQRGLSNQIIPPIFVAGKTEDDILAWYRQTVNRDVYKTMSDDPEFPLIEVAASLYNRKRLLWLLDKLDAPQNRDEYEFVDAAMSGEPISLLLPEEFDMESVFSPVIRYEDGLWRWSLDGGEPSAPCVTAQLCMNDYVKAMEFTE